MVGLGEFSKNLKTLSLKRGSVFQMELFPKDGVTPKNEGDISRNKYFVVLGIDGNRISVCSTLINTDTGTPASPRFEKEASQSQCPRDQASEYMIL